MPKFSNPNFHDLAVHSALFLDSNCDALFVLDLWHGLALEMTGNLSLWPSPPHAKTSVGWWLGRGLTVGKIFRLRPLRCLVKEQLSGIKHSKFNQV